MSIQTVRYLGVAQDEKLGAGRTGCGGRMDKMNKKGVILLVLIYFGASSAIFYEYDLTGSSCQEILGPLCIFALPAVVVGAFPVIGVAVDSLTARSIDRIKEDPPGPLQEQPVDVSVVQQISRLGFIRTIAVIVSVIAGTVIMGVSFFLLGIMSDYVRGLGGVFAGSALLYLGAKLADVVVRE